VTVTCSRIIWILSPLLIKAAPPGVSGSRCSHGGITGKQGVLHHQPQVGGVPIFHIETPAEIVGAVICKLTAVERQFRRVISTNGTPGATDIISGLVILKETIRERGFTPIGIIILKARLNVDRPSLAQGTIPMNSQSTNCGDEPSM